MAGFHPGPKHSGPYHLCFIGFGNIGRGLAELLLEKTSALREQYGIEWRITGVATRRMGWLANPDGLDVAALLAGAPAGQHVPAPQDVRSWLAAARADVLFEMSSLDVVAGQPAISYLEAALELGAHAITANKGTVVYGYHHLRALAAARGRGFRHEATVMAGIPIFSLFRETLPAVELRGFRGVLNSTTNLILGAMEEGRSLEQAVIEAQALGITETDPSFDIDGWDAAVKVAALAIVLMGAPLGLEWVARQGIGGLSGEEVRAARAAGTPYKLVCRAERRDGAIVASVGPEKVPLDDSVARVDGPSALVSFVTDTPALTVVEDGCATNTTAYGMLADFIGLVRS
jgi:homoserine dehydrogenase